LGFVDIARSALLPDVSPVRIRYREAGEGPPIVFLHGGWGYEIYPIDRQIAALAPEHRILVPDRSGYGGSPPIATLPPDFHRRAVDETWAVVDALGLERPVLWGHSDGAIIALLLALAAPDRIAGAIVEAAHYLRRKPASHAFFESMIANPASLGAAVIRVLTRDHGDAWGRVVERHSRAWLRISDEAVSATDDFYDGHLADVQVPVLVVHGARDPRTEPGELDRLRAALPRARFEVMRAAGHSPHSERAAADEVTASVRTFVDGVARLRRQRSRSTHPRP
jgi:pimeloyl-ACP methyl ester carboxylesterase